MNTVAILQPKQNRMATNMKRDRVFSLLKVNGFKTLGELADRLGISNQSLSNYLNRPGPIGNFDILEKMARELKTTPDFIDPFYSEAIQVKNKNINKSKSIVKTGGEDFKDKYYKMLEENLRLREELEKYRKN